MWKSEDVSAEPEPAKVTSVSWPTGLKLVDTAQHDWSEYMKNQSEHLTNSCFVTGLLAYERKKILWF